MYRVPIAGLDSGLIGTPYADMATYANNFLNNNSLRKSANLKAPTFSSTGPFKYSNTAAPGMPAGMFTAGHFLFFMDWDICETDKSPCVLRQSETITVRRDGKPAKTTTKPAVTPSIGNAWTKAGRKTPLGKCNKTLVYVDGPGDIAITGGTKKQGFVEDVTQKVEILDGASGSVVDTRTESISIGVDAAGKLTASP